MIAMVTYFSTTWAFAPLAYLRFPDIALPDFYSAFQVKKLIVFVISQTQYLLQVLNSWTGALVFVLLGLGSTRFRAVVTGGVNTRVGLTWISHCMHVYNLSLYV